MYKVLLLALVTVTSVPVAFAHHDPYQQTTCWWGYGYEPCYDRDHDNVPDEIDKCPDEPAYIAGGYEGCPYKTYEYTVEQQYYGPEWILTLVKWNKQKIIDDTTYTNALEWLLKHKIITIK